MIRMGVAFSCYLSTKIEKKINISGYLFDVILLVFQSQAQTI